MQREYFNSFLYKCLLCRETLTACLLCGGEYLDRIDNSLLYESLSSVQANDILPVYIRVVQIYVLHVQVGETTLIT